MVWKSSQNMVWGLFSKHLGVAKTLFCQKLTFLKRIMRNRFDNPSHSGLQSLSKASKLDLKISKSSNICRSRLWKRTMSLCVDVALRAASIFENNDFPFCECCPAGGLNPEKSSFWLYLFNFLQVAKLAYLTRFEPREYARQLSFEKCCRMHQSTSQMDVWSPSYDRGSCMVRRELVSQGAGEPLIQ